MRACAAGAIVAPGSSWPVGQRIEGSFHAVLDVETTGRSPPLHHRIIEIAVALCDEEGHIETTWNTLVHANRVVGPTGLLPEMVEPDLAHSAAYERHSEMTSPRQIRSLSSSCVRLWCCSGMSPAPH